MGLKDLAYAALGILVIIIAITIFTAIVLGSMELICWSLTGETFHWLSVSKETAERIF